MSQHRAAVVHNPWRRTIRGLFQATITFAPIAPLVYQAAVDQDPALAGGIAGAGLAVMAGVTRVMALEPVEAFLRRFVPWLAAEPRQDADGEHEAAGDGDA